MFSVPPSWANLPEWTPTMTSSSGKSAARRLRSRPLRARRCAPAWQDVDWTTLRECTLTIAEEARRLRHSLLERRVPLWLETPVTELVREGGRVCGVVATREGRPCRIRATSLRSPRLAPTRPSGRWKRPWPNPGARCSA